MNQKKNQNEEIKDKYTIADLADEFEISHRAIRFYEDEGILSPQREGAGGRIRVYSNGQRTRLRLTLRGKRLGLSLAEIKQIVDLYDGPGGSLAQLEKFLQVISVHKQVLERQLLDIKDQLAELTAHELACKKLLKSNTQKSTLKRKKVNSL